ncbi:MULTISPECIES: MBL fold metallo-hydrolase [Caballeronia]|uniref:Beta-lactamase domain-containing protein n=1 Tax=Caballeronia cordobensis TaxID=1353886 RepID=A0A158IJA2_CABCO|nr:MULTISPECIES: MBL fold metallo-hydrolase [Caballeronia]AET89586.1 beta-lactamase domain-containing protein [Burkholderia sp. YI23]BAO86852.1 beta-lactamase domain-containing protein [Burkholderia sp. RPE67]MCE4541349.1 MBL fold metallo-hydrolase [Caballeronia sp. PC1]MCE4569607.1 MBL fold metallo-hydrolase [Caballeronia sp. CLC5]SAL56181.1 beta-lactamase domain-containing protein [Caballeronia cordobensis]
MRFASLGSGSEGNALLVEASSGTTTTRVLLDCGFSGKEVARRLERLNCRVEDLDAIVITHEHSDHIGSALTLARKWSIPLHMSWGTARAIGADEAGVELNVLWGDESVAIGDLSVLPYTVPHDAREPLQYVFSDGACRLGVLTDVGVSTPHITNVLSGCDALVLESNHDVEMLAASRYPPMLKARIGGNHGHLNNEAAAAILASLDRSRLRHLVAAHLSQQNNLPHLAQAALAAVLDASAVDVVVATQAEGFDWLAL